MKNSDIQSFNELPAALTCRRIDFENAHVFQGFIPGTWFLAVSGMKPWANMEVYPQPLIYKTRPDYWEIEIIGCLRGIGMPTIAPYSQTIELSGIIGNKGIEVVGANKSEKFDIS